ncbi:hypothetical protein SAMN06296028_12811 [Kocuria indica]|uniref:Major facilitator superfamily (MFS) profile domain-containing protein n=2 Tax=Micrococcaceae TaxID=1268 RepID=A0A1X7EBS9_9MICC|nr:hypothetical protein SAMN06296028_12811 [Kocuria indica]
MDSGASPKRRGLYTSFVLSAPPAGIVLACVAFLWAASLGDDALLTWAWRIPFLVSVVLFALAVFIRAKLEESPEYEQALARAPPAPRARSWPACSPRRSASAVSRWCARPTVRSWRVSVR